jgi:hypothetical protein
MSKTVIINPELFKIGKTKKTKPKPLVTAKSIKQTLINRIKEKQKSKKVNPEILESKKVNPDSEFQESEKFLNEILKNKNTTIKNHQPLNNYTGIKPISKNVENILFKPEKQMKLNYKIDDENPHGCLKNGLKQCFRDYQKNQIQPITNIKISEKPYNEKDLVKRIVESEINKAINGKIEFSSELVKKYEEKPLVILEDIKLDVPLIESFETPKIFEMSKIECLPEIPVDFSSEPSEPTESSEPSEPTQVLRIVKRKYTLGKNRNKIGILMKGKKSKKNIVEYTKELRKMANEDIKKKLRERGMLKVGSTAPPEIVRKIFENMELAGDIVNEDKDVHLHNLTNQE